MESLNLGISLSPYLLLVHGILGLGLLMLCFDILQASDSDSLLVRGFHRWRLGRTRLGKVLLRLGIPRYSDDASATTVELKACAARCRKCPSVALCDHLRRQRELCMHDFRFCPNRDYLERVTTARQMAVASSSSRS